MNKEPLVSVCVQTYQHASFIRECLDSILMQKTNFPFELILGEDESTDGTREICIEYAEKYPDTIRLFLRSRKDVIYIDGNPTGRYNFIQNLKAARGKYIALCEGDDYWTDPYKLQKQVDFLETNYAYIAHTHNGIIVNGNSEIISKTEVLADKIISLKNLLEGFKPITASIIFRSTILNEPFPGWFNKILGADRYLLIMMALHGNIYHSGFAMSAYRNHPGGIVGALRSEGKKKKIFLARKQVHFWIYVENELPINVKRQVRLNIILKLNHLSKLYLESDKFLKFFTLKLLCFYWRLTRFFKLNGVFIKYMSLFLIR